ncbi:hypothetical protein [Clostridium beijerinckii]|uniref:hypothetical protein n=1 Tax=Clostridium beijerinckii TaxID=1520 RepID=UPI00156F5B4E|nr:hypothetical protein [Clostridium beijerinckii]NRT73839.1 hypothetical protein [Clostridium beijerinckii]
MIKRVDKNQVLKEFDEKYIENRYKIEIPKIIKKYNKNKEIIHESLTGQFDLLCRETTLHQEKNLKGEIKYIYFSMLRTKLLENKGQWRIDLYDEKWFLDKEECSINIDLDFIYEPLFKHMEELSEKKKEYLRTIKERDIEAIKLTEANRYHSLALKIVKNTLKNFLECTSYKEMKKKEDIVIMAGEYMDAGIQINAKKP